MNRVEVEVERVERDMPCRSWEIELRITNGEERGWYQFQISDYDWRHAREPGGMGKDGDHSPSLVVEKQASIAAEVPL